MKTTFYDVKKKEKVEADVTDKVTYGEAGRLRYALRAQTPDGRTLTKFVSKDDWEKTQV